MIHTYPVHKDAPPWQTIHRIRQILAASGFPREEEHLEEIKAFKSCFSCHLFFKNYPLLIANGKGMTPGLARASAYAEFIERLQCRMDFLFTKVGLIFNEPPFSKFITLPISEWLPLWPKFITKYFPGIRKFSNNSTESLPFVDVFHQNIVSLPYSMLRWLTRTNGMCAGNTPEEAITHGICEIFERNVISLLFKGNLPGLPSIEMKEFPIRNFFLRGLINDLFKSGIDVLVKDATLGGQLPVLGVVLLDRQRGTCQVCFGADPNIEIAFSRCLTEAFQGTRYLPFPCNGGTNQKSPLDILNYPHLLIDRLVSNNGRACPMPAFIKARSSRSRLNHLLQQVKKLRKNIYIHDFSLLGFPTYYIFIEDLSPMFSLAKADTTFLQEGIPLVRNVLFNMEEVSFRDAVQSTTILKKQFFSSFKPFEYLFSEMVLKVPISDWMGLRQWICFLLLKIGDHNQASRILNHPPAQLLGQEDPPPKEIMRRLEQTLAKPKALKIPRCSSLSNCRSCPCRKDCYLEEWSKIRRRLMTIANSTDQEKLLCLLSDRVKLR